MNSSIARRPSALLALGGVLLALLLAGSAGVAPKAEAGTSAYCNNFTLGAQYTPSGSCWGKQRNLYAVFGWGDHHSVCIGFSVVDGPGMINRMCTPGPGSGVYNPLGTTLPLYPAIENNAKGLNLAHGVAYQP